MAENVIHQVGSVNASVASRIMSYIWTPQTSKAFYEAAFRLGGTEKANFGEHQYPRAGRPEGASSSGHYTLSLHHELKLADHVAYLAQHTEGPTAISAACLEEREDGLLVRLASNEKLPETTLAELGGILDTLSRYSRKDIRRDTFTEIILDQVVSLSKTRIQQRILPSWWCNSSKPRKDGKERKPLTQRVAGVLGDLSRHKKLLTPTVLALRELQGHLQAFSSSEPSNLQESLKTILQAAFKVSACGQFKSLEARLRAAEHGALRRLATRREVLEVDKLARYYRLCRELGRIAHQPEYKELLSRISVDVCRRFRPVARQGAKTQCHVHAEVQLVVWYAQGGAGGPAHPPPRAMGCSKSACYLCDALIRHLGVYHISAAHRRLYPLWTIPDGPEVALTEEAAETLRVFIARTTRVMQSKGVTARDFPMESRVDLPLSGPSTATASLASRLSVASSPTASGTGGPSPSPSEATTVGCGTAGPSGQRRGEPRPTSPEAPSSPDEPCADAAEEDERGSVASSRPASSQEASESASSTVRLEEEDLDTPFEHHMGRGVPLLEVRLGHLTLSFECAAVEVGRLLVTRAAAGGGGEGVGSGAAPDAAPATEVDATTQVVHTKDIPTAGVLRLDCPSESAALKFRVRCFGGVAVDVEVLWDSYPGWKSTSKQSAVARGDGV